MNIDDQEINMIKDKLNIIKNNHVELKSKMNKIKLIIEREKEYDNKITILESNINLLLLYFDDFYYKYYYDMFLKRNILKFLIILYKLNLFFCNNCEVYCIKLNIFRIITFIKNFYYPKLIHMMNIYQTIIDD